jgi:hemerythrin superfamily protein
MKNSNEILDMMISHHALIELLLTEFKDDLDKNRQAADKSFDEFRWELDKHIFVEERVIFKFCNVVSAESCKIVFALVKEHDEMLKMINRMKEDLTANNRVDVSNFQTLLTRHREVEERKLYPKMDQELDKAQKELIMARINEIPVKREEE